MKPVLSLGDTKGILKSVDNIANIPDETIFGALGLPGHKELIQGFVGKGEQGRDEKNKQAKRSARLRSSEAEAEAATAAEAAEEQRQAAGKRTGRRNLLGVGPAGGGSVLGVGGQKSLLG